MEGLKHNLVSVGKLVDKGYLMQFKDGKYTIKDQLRKMIAPSTNKRGNVFQLNPS